MGYYKDRQKTQDLQNNMGYSEKWLFNEPPLCNESICFIIHEGNLFQNNLLIYPVQRLCVQFVYPYYI